MVTFRTKQIRFCGLLLATLSFSLMGQVSDDRYESLKRALKLSDGQMWLLQEKNPIAFAMEHPARRTAFQDPLTLAQAHDSPQYRILDHSQQAGLVEIEKVLDRFDMASQAIELGLINAHQWPGQTLCYYPICADASNFGLSDAQVGRFARLIWAAREPLETQIAQIEKHRLELLHSGLSAESPAVAQLGADISKLYQQSAETRPPRDLMLAVLDDGQKAKLAAFETALQVASEAIELGLIPYPLKGEVSCY